MIENRRCFHLYADKKTVKEISMHVYRTFPKNRLTVTVYKDGLWLTKGTNYIWLPIAQLMQIACVKALEALKEVQP